MPLAGIPFRTGTFSCVAWIAARALVKLSNNNLQIAGGCALTANVDTTVLFSAVLRPHRSAGPGTLRTVICLVAVILLVVGIVFMAVGAWPVAPFLGIEVLLLGLALRLNAHAGNTYEAISLTPRALTVRRVNHWGKQSEFAFLPYWLQVNIDDPPERWSPLELRSHGRSLVIASFLPPNERVQLAKTLRRELSRVTRVARPT